jgi:hypothetical protein
LLLDESRLDALLSELESSRELLLFERLPSALIPESSRSLRERLLPEKPGEPEPRSDPELRDEPELPAD